MNDNIFPEYSSELLAECGNHKFLFFVDLSKTAQYIPTTPSEIIDKLK